MLEHHFASAPPQAVVSDSCDLAFSLPAFQLCPVIFSIVQPSTSQSFPFARARQSLRHYPQQHPVVSVHSIFSYDVRSLFAFADCVAQSAIIVLEPAGSMLGTCQVHHAVGRLIHSDYSADLPEKVKNPERHAGRRQDYPIPRPRQQHSLVCLHHRANPVLVEQHSLMNRSRSA